MLPKATLIHTRAGDRVCTPCSPAPDSSSVSRRDVETAGSSGVAVGQDSRLFHGVRCRSRELHVTVGSDLGRSNARVLETASEIYT
eukprot:4811587-Pleurochrysis_carterae.AAC.6